MKKLFKFCSPLLTIVKILVNTLFVLALVYMHCLLFLMFSLSFCLVCVYTLTHFYMNSHYAWSNTTFLT